MRKIKYFVSLSVVALTLCGCSKKADPIPTQDKVTTYFAYQHENLVSNLDYLVFNPSIYGSRDSTLRYNCLKGENDAMQLIMHAVEDVSSWDFTIKNDLTDDSGNTLGKDNFQIYAEHYMLTQGTNEKKALPGYYPDALIPIENYKMRIKNFIAKDSNQGVYVNVLVPEDARAGKYTGNGVLTVDGKEYNIPIEVQVHNGVMPKENHFTSCYLIWYDEIPNGEKDNHSPELEREYYDMILSKRISPDSLPNEYEETPTIFANTMANIVAPNEKINAYRMPVEGSNFSEARVRSYLQALVNKNIALRQAGKDIDLFKKLYFYVDDEPSQARYQVVRDHDKLLYDLKAEYALQLYDYPDLQDSLRRIRNVVTRQFDRELVADETKGGIQTWCPTFNYFQTAENRAIYKERQASNLRYGGEDVWWYGCINPVQYYPSHHTNADTIYSRIIPWMQYNYGVNGLIYWNVCYYSKYASDVTTSRNIWYDPITWDDCAGDGQLVYPGYEYNILSPITTMRLENLLGGIEEYEYFYMLNNYVNTYNLEHSTTYDLNTMLTNQMATLYNGVQTVHSNKSGMLHDTANKQIMVVRDKLLTAIDKFIANPEDGITYLLSL